MKPKFRPGDKVRIISTRHNDSGTPLLVVYDFGNAIQLDNNIKGPFHVAVTLSQVSDGCYQNSSGTEYRIEVSE